MFAAPTNELEEVESELGEMTVGQSRSRSPISSFSMGILGFSFGMRYLVSTELLPLRQFCFSFDASGLVVIRFTPNYISQRLEELLNDKHVKPQEFARLYGDDRLQMTIKWFRRAEDDLSGKRA